MVHRGAAYENSQFMVAAKILEINEKAIFAGKIGLTAS